MSDMCALGLMSALCCGSWAIISATVGLSSWIGFAGCTTYFAALSEDCKGISCIKKSIFCNLLGVACAIMAIYLGTWFPVLDKFGLTTALVSFTILILSQYNVLQISSPAFNVLSITKVAVNQESIQQIEQKKKWPSICW